MGFLFGMITKIVAGGTPATAMAAVGVPTNRKVKICDPSLQSMGFSLA